MAYDDVILRMGEFGRYQRRIYLLLCLPAISCAFHKIVGVFLSAQMNARCLLPHENPENATYILPPHMMNASYPWDYDHEEWLQCFRLDVPSVINKTRINRYVDTSTGDTLGQDLVTPNSLNNQGLKPCETYVYDRSKYKSTTISEWNLVCDKAWLKATGDSLFMVGVMLGSMIFGGLSDKFGRRPIFFLSLVIQLVGGILVAVSPEFISYVILRLIVGSTTSGVFLVAYVIALEMVGPRKRLVAGVGCQLFFTTGYILTAGFAYFITDWRMLQVAITVPSIAFLLYWWFIPESARWLLTKGRVQEAKDILQRASLENGVEMPSEALDTLLNNNSEDSTPDYKKPSLFDLFRYPNLRRKSILLSFNWLVNSGTYYGLSWHVSNLGGNDYVNFVISGFVEVPAYTFLIFTLNRWGRKIILCGCMLISGIALLGILFVPTVCLAMIGKLTITSSYGAIYVFTAEQFPTVIRNVGLGASSTFARIGGVIAPYVIHLSKIWMPLPFVIFGSCVLFGGAMSLLLPETLNKKLPETIQDGELFGKKSSEKKKKQQLDVEQLNEIDVIKPLKPQENGIHEKQNG
ncbi:Organic cation transporter protein [Eufriesea mexicana]|uniref:Organic cation transporter protein n=1 Tax=Eufriesea mexicana TaxID=516756 RepID=A0A310SKC5_9HYME|nr:Organic cation transporter protein [Eufriesea mexicana]